MLLGVGLASGGVSRAQTVPFPSSKWNRVLIVSGGPNPQYNQYAIESNALYVAALTNNAKWRRILFADGNPASKTISTIADTQDTKAGLVASRILAVVISQLNAPTLTPIDGASTPDSITQNLTAFATAKNTTGPELVYVTGHGAPGKKPDQTPDYVNTHYNSWGQDYSVPQLAHALQTSTSSAPLVLVMVQCFGGGFANVMFQDGDPTKPIWNHDFCGFFASIPERMASGCTSQVNERDYQDFTTHFFAALSGVSRDGRRIKGADYDHDGKVSFDEAYSYTQINDDSIDVPLSTSDAYLRFIFGPEPNTDWLKTPFSTLLQNATPQQSAVLTQLSDKLGLSGEDRLDTVQTRLTELPKTPQKVQMKWPEGVAPDQFLSSFSRLKKLLADRFPNIKAASEAEKKQALTDATALIAANPADMDIVYSTLTLNAQNADTRTVEEARLLRFLREGRSIILAKRLQQTGTPDQKAIFVRLRTSETRSIF